jgi:hypothetical protein
MARLAIRAAEMEDKLEQEDLLNWRRHPVTARFLMALEVWQVGLMEQWASGVFQKDTAQATVEANAAAIGERTCLNRILKLTADEINQILSSGEEDDEELDLANRARTQAARGD